MNCPFLRETRVRHCRRHSALGKWIPRGQGAAAEGRCSSASYVDCPAYKERPEDAGGPPCPLLVESLVQFCAASPVTKFVPYSDAGGSRCASGSFRYCDLYLELAFPGREEARDAVPLREDVLYTVNHWWVELDEDGPCHLGIDAFLARLFGRVDRIEYLIQRGVARPAAVFTVNGRHCQTEFPEPIHITGYNSYLRGDPGRLTAEPYTRGWLFEGLVSGDRRERLRNSLLDAAAARARLDESIRQVNERIQQYHPEFAADGGVFAEGLLRELEREEALRLFHQFGAPPQPTEGVA
ncbi:MAG: hypothetical protein KIT09_19405 [Bryobacteraceae bacterium]|nr:hypothetical protein [Bryobacteraceae bacterium]